MKAAFKIDMKPEIESGEYKVTTEDGREVRIICWDADVWEETDIFGGKRQYPIIAVVKQDIGFNKLRRYDKEGKAAYSCHCGIVDDLYVEDTGEKLTPFEKELKETINSFTDGCGKITDAGAVFYAKKLMSVLEKQGEVIYTPKIDGWLSRSNDGELRLFWTRPYSDKELKEKLGEKKYKELMKMMKPDPDCCHKLPKELFPEVTASGEPLKIEVLLKK